jgi:hypothetical protein
LTVVAQDPTVQDPTGPRHKKIVRAQIEIPAEELSGGPRGYRVHVVDYDASRDIFYKEHKLRPRQDDFAGATDKQLLEDPGFHCQNVYALVMRTLARFEQALGRRVAWGFYGHHLNVVPHAFADANAFYSPDDHALLFGYFPSREGKMVYTCLSHDVVVHETTHALLDGLRERFTDPSSADQAAFHEGFADVVALLSVFSLEGVASRIIDHAQGKKKNPKLISKKAITKDKLRRSGLLGLAEELGKEITAIRGSALRRSVELEPDPHHYQEDEDFLQPHRRGEILAAAVLNAFLDAWVRRLEGLGQIKTGFLSRERVVEEGATIADTLLTMAIRALDYTPPVHLEFSDFLSAVLTSDAEVRPNDSRYRLRDLLLASFGSYGIKPASIGEGAAGEGHWVPPPDALEYGRTHFEAMRSNPDEVFRFLWENRKKLKLTEDAYGRMISVRPSVRVGPDGFVLNEVVAEYIQTLTISARELNFFDIRRPDGMPMDTQVSLHGGGTLIFDEYGRLKFHIHNNVVHRDRQSVRLDHMWNYGFFRKGSSALRRFSNIHRQRAVGHGVRNPEGW